MTSIALPLSTDVKIRKHFAPPVLILLSIDSIDVGKEADIEDWDKVFSTSIVASFPVLFIRGVHLLWISYFVNIAETLFVILCQVQFQLCFALPHCIPIQPNSMSIFFPGYLSWFPLPMHLLLSPYFAHQFPTQTQQSLVFFAQFLAPAELLHSMEDFFKDLSALLHSLVPRGSYWQCPWGAGSLFS